MIATYEQAYELARKFEWLQQQYNQSLNSPQEKQAEKEFKECHDLLAKYDNIVIERDKLDNLVVLFKLDVSGVRYPLAL